MDKENKTIIMMFIIIFIIGTVPIFYFEYNNSKLQIEKQKTEQLKLQLELNKIKYYRGD